GSAAQASRLPPGRARAPAGGLRCGGGTMRPWPFSDRGGDTLFALKREGYENLRQFPDGRWIGTHRAVAHRLFVRLHRFGYEECFDFPSSYGAIEAARAWDGLGDPPGPWIKHKTGAGE